MALKGAVHLEHEMSIKTPYLAIGSILLVAIVVACDSRKENAFRSPTAPPPVTPGAVLDRLELMVPPSIEPGETVQLTANAVKSDRSVENVTAQAQWTSSDPLVVETSSTGVAKGVARGEALIMVRYQSRSASTHTIVTPAGTHKLYGTVTDSGIGLAGVTVAIIDGVGAGLSTVTAGNGTYALYGVGDRIRLQAKAANYLNRIEELDVTDHQTLNVEMQLEGRRMDLTTITFSVSATAVTAGGNLTVNWIVPPQVEPRRPDEGILLININTGRIRWTDGTSGTNSGTRTLSAPTEPGEYEFQYRDFDDSVAPYFRILGRSRPVTVTATASASYLGDR